MLTFQNFPNRENVLKFNSGNTKTVSETCLKLPEKTTETHSKHF